MFCKIKWVVFGIASICLVSCNNFHNEKELEKKYFDNGKISASYELKDMARDGVFVLYYPSGEVYRVGGYKEDKLDGVLVELSENGDTLIKRIYALDKMLFDIQYKNNKIYKIVDFNKQRIFLYNSAGKLINEIEADFGK